MHFDIGAVPFSRYGSYLACAQLAQQGVRAAGVYLRTLHGDAPRREICRFALWRDEREIAAEISASPSCLRLQSDIGFVEIIFAGAKTLRIRGEGVGLRLLFAPELYDHAVPRAQGWQLNCFSNRLNLALMALAGTLTVDAPLREVSAEHLLVTCNPDACGVFEIALSEFQSTWPRVDALLADDFHASERAVANEFQYWLQRAPSVPAEYAAARELAAYIQWACVVAPHGYFARPALLMSNNWLTAVWSWDHCFNAMALIDSAPSLAWDQLLLLFDAQDRDGALPDCISDQTIVWNFCKPPIHGWALQWLLRRGKTISSQQLQQIYAPLCRWTEWWFAQRDDAGDGLPQYLHGNDSGWDNSTIFDFGLPVASPDLTAFLIVQMQTLAEIAQRLEQAHAATRWQRRADDLLNQLLANYWRGDRFVALCSSDRVQQESETLLLFLPLILGKKLPQDIRTQLIECLQRENTFLTAFGVASESVASPLYQADGYWRGPIWAPAIMLIVDGLLDSGEHALARDIARRFCAMVARSGFAENFNALTGAGLRDPAHTWTASVFLILAHDLGANSVQRNNSN